MAPRTMMMWKVHMSSTCHLCKSFSNIVMSVMSLSLCETGKRHVATVATGVIYLTVERQRALHFHIMDHLPWRHFGRKNAGNPVFFCKHLVVWL